MESDVVREIVALRTSHEKHFLLRDGTCNVVKTRHPQHYRRHGMWRDYRARWHERGGMMRLAGMPYDAEVDVIRPRLDCQDWHATLVAPEITAPPEIIRAGRVVRWSLPTFDLYLLPHYTGISPHVIFKHADAPRSFRWHTDGPWSDASGMDNLDRTAERRAIETNRIMDVRCERDGVALVATWSGRVKAMDDQRRRYYSDDVAYPARMRLS